MPKPNKERRVRLCRKFSFEAAHFLAKHEGDCKHIHGHTYHLEVCVIGSPAHAAGRSNDGMVMDSSKLSSLVKEHVMARYDHHLVVNSSQKSFTQALDEMGMRFVETPFQPTIENLVLEFACILKACLPKEVELCSLYLHETDSTYCEWHETDN